jgi:hypothetical protein
LLPVKYVHVVFTLPEFLNEFVLINHKLIYDILFEASWHALHKCADTYLGVQTIFRARVMFLLLGALFDKSLKIPESRKNKNPVDELTILAKKKDWVVHSEKTRLSPTKVIEYLGRYIRRVAISNHRIELVEDEKVCFSYRDYTDGGKRKRMELNPVEFIRRFMLHILPARFCKVRYYGILAIKNRTDKLMLCFVLLDKIKLSPRFQGLTMYQILELLTGKDYSLCPCCKTGHLQIFKPPDAD